MVVSTEQRTPICPFPTPLLRKPCYNATTYYPFNLFMRTHSIAFANLIAVALFLSIPLSLAHADTFPQRVDVASDGTIGNDISGWPIISADGRYVVFTSMASNLVSGDTDNEKDIFVHDVVTGSTTRVSVASDGSQGNGGSPNPSDFEKSLYADGISADGRYVVFQSYASNLVPDDTNASTDPFGGGADIFVHDMLTGSTTRVSVASDGTQANVSSHDPEISPDGRYVAFDSAASNLVPDDTNASTDPFRNGTDVFVHDMLTGSTTRVSVASDGTQGDDGSSVGGGGAAFSSDDRYVVFTSTATNLVPDDTDGVADVFVHDMLTGSTTRVSVASDGSQAGNGSQKPSISADGRYVVFQSFDTNLAPSYDDSITAVFVHDMLTGATIKIGGFSGNLPTITEDGRYVVDMGSVYDTLSGTYRSFSGGVRNSSISANAQYVAYGSGSIFVARNPFLSTNQAPVLDPIGDKSVDENSQLQFTVVATDPDGDALTYSASNLPAGASFDPDTHTFTWTPNYGQAGNYTDVEFTVTDNGTPMQ